ncbi:MAG: pantetheine-phosphate adenylyltransferase [Magnetococcales bacterium]|nr:pantetheine-phosphate adenylyltransferase [Magnetococcales bacterium]
MKRTAVYPGSFDPVTLGHVDIITRGAGLFDKLIVAVAINRSKQSLFSEEERIHLLKESIPHLDNVEVCGMSGLLVDYVIRVGANALLRGLRAVSDFEYEFQMAAMNRKLAPEVETVFLMGGENTTFVSSRLVREIASMGGTVTPFVPAPVIPALQARFRKHP